MTDTPHLPAAGPRPQRLTDSYGNRFYQVGDLVTRDGTDIHRVVDHNGCNRYAPDGFTVVCVKAPAGGWTKVGEEEFNVCRRYEPVGEVIDPMREVDAFLAYSRAAEGVDRGEVTRDQVCEEMGKNWLTIQTQNQAERAWFDELGITYPVAHS